MATAQHNLSEYDIEDVPNGRSYKIGIVVSEWNEKVTASLLDGARSTLLKHEVQEENIIVKTVPGTYELSLGAQWLLKTNRCDAVISIGSVIKGETPHFDFVCHSAAQGIREVSLKYDQPVIFCVLTDLNQQQAWDRSGGSYGNKGVEGAVAALKMCALQVDLIS